MVSPRHKKAVWTPAWMVWWDKGPEQHAAADGRVAFSYRNEVTAIRTLHPLGKGSPILSLKRLDWLRSPSKTLK